MSYRNHYICSGEGTGCYYNINYVQPCKVLKYDENKFAIGIPKNSSTPYNNEINPQTYIKFFLQNTDKGVCI